MEVSHLMVMYPAARKRSTRRRAVLIEAFGSQYQQGEPYKFTEFPVAPQQPAGSHADLVTTKDGKSVGISSAAVYSYYYRETISQTPIDIDQPEIGNEVMVH